MFVENRVVIESLGPRGADVAFVQSLEHAGADVAGLDRDAAQREDGGGERDVPHAVEPHRGSIWEGDPERLHSQHRNPGEFHQSDNRQIRDPESRNGDEEKHSEGNHSVRRAAGVPRAINADQHSEGEREPDGGDIEDHGGGQALEDAAQHGAVVLDAAQLAGKEVAHVEPVLLVERAVEVEFFAERFLHLRRDFGIQLTPRIRAARRQRDHEKRNQADAKKQERADQKSADEEVQHGRTGLKHDSSSAATRGLEVAAPLATLRTWHARKVPPVQRASSRSPQVFS